jgi:tetratricopeptide (TPR) repeat protein
MSTGAAIADEYYRDALDASTPDEALALLKLTFENSIEHFDGLYLRAVQHLRKSEFDKALEDADFMIMLRERAGAGYLVRGLARYFAQDYDNALGDLDEAVKIEPRWPTVWAVRGAMRIRRGRYPQGLDDLDVALRLKPGNKTAQAERTLAGRRIRLTIRELTALIDKNASDEQALIRRGDLHFLIGDFASALADYQKAIEVGEEPSTYVLRQRFLAKQKLGEVGDRSSESRTRSGMPKRAGAVVRPARFVTPRWLHSLIPGR